MALESRRVVFAPHCAPNIDWFLMKKFSSFILAVVTSAFASQAAIAGAADFTLLNRTGFILREVYLSASHKDDWGSDRMGSNVLENGKSRLFKFSNKSSCKQDLRVVFDDDGSDAVWEEFDLCEINKITLKFNRKSNEVSADTE